MSFSYVFLLVSKAVMPMEAVVTMYREPGKGMQNIAKQDPSRARKKS